MGVRLGGACLGVLLTWVRAGAPETFESPGSGIPHLETSVLQIRISAFHWARSKFRPLYCTTRSVKYRYRLLFQTFLFFIFYFLFFTLVVEDSLESESEWV